MPNPIGPEVALFMVEVRVVDRHVAACWYEQVLGWRVVLDDPRGRFTLLEGAAGRVALKEGERVESRKAVRLVFQVENVEVERVRLVALGVELWPIRILDEGYRELRIVDPEGTPISLFSWGSVAAGGQAGVSSSP